MKKERNLLKVIKPHELSDAAKKAFESAEMHLISAEAIAMQKHYGIPVSHLILSTEQTVAGILIYAQHLGFDLKNVPGIHLFFTDHIIKHKFVTIFSITFKHLKFTMGFINELRDNDSRRLKFDKKINKKEIETLFKDLPEMLDWWDNANLQKNKGFYIDYSNCLETPMQVTKKEYKQGHEIVKNFQNQVMEMIRYFDNLPIENKKELSDNLKNFRLEETLEKIIVARKNKMKNHKSNKSSEISTEDEEEKQEE